MIGPIDSRSVCIGAPVGGRWGALGRGLRPGEAAAT